jgi:hypothetical protein
VSIAVIDGGIYGDDYCRMEVLKIVLFSTAAAIAYGILHDQVTAHVCVEYFTIAHPPVFPTESPFWLAIGWGIIATWWVGLPLGGLLAAAARLGSNPKLRLADLYRPIVLLMAACGIVAMLAGAVGAALVSARVPVLAPYWASVIPAEKHVAFAFAAWAHAASYLAGALGGMLLIGRTVRLRARAAKAAA